MHMNLSFEYVNFLKSNIHTITALHMQTAADLVMQIVSKWNVEVAYI